MTAGKEQLTTNVQFNLNSTRNVNLNSASDFNSSQIRPVPNLSDLNEMASPRIRHALGSGVRQHWREILCKADHGSLTR